MFRKLMDRVKALRMKSLLLATAASLLVVLSLAVAGIAVFVVKPIKYEERVERVIYIDRSGPVEKIQEPEPKKPAKPLPGLESFTVIPTKVEKPKPSGKDITPEVRKDVEAFFKQNPPAPKKPPDMPEVITLEKFDKLLEWTLRSGEQTKKLRDFKSKLSRLRVENQAVMKQAKVAEALNRCQNAIEGFEKIQKPLSEDIEGEMRALNNTFGSQKATIWAYKWEAEFKKLGLKTAEVEARFMELEKEIAAAKKSGGAP